MSNFAPPGWYPDPEPTAGAVGAHERFWDGAVWTDRTRPLPSAAPRPSARPAVAGPAEPATALSDASPAYGHPAIPEPVEGVGYGYPAPVHPQSPVPISPGPAAVPPPPYGYQSPGYPVQPGLAPPGPVPGRRTGLIVGLLAGALTLVVLVAGVSISLFEGSGRAGHPASAAVPPGAGHAPRPSSSGDHAAPGLPTGPAATPTDPPSGGAGALPPGTAPASPAAGPVQDAAHNWSVPLPAGWSVAEHDASTAVLLVTGPYQCATQGGCVRGNFEIDTKPASGPDAQSAARQSMSEDAPQLFGQLDSHQELASGPITVAGQSGYAVRWYVKPQQAEPGYLLLIAVPAAGGGFTTIVGSVDDDPQAPRPAVLDQIAAGIQSTNAPNAT
ncbi:DUF2510 domain-containing protein [Kitasatospora kifunensis]|uniref:DUF2510 domain-containing protein n=1 Tax=Kitasatospora kifunensis TaxID=58351 RepID=A0A7W7R1A7_KITKI|nr:DUF2510 domain-containing protein [Kitasatospora kifunensis]MBB4922931.1 hypothetical protein [Kitasatospora kifunensis]